MSIFKIIRNKYKSRSITKKINKESKWVDNYSIWYGSIQSLIHTIDDSENVCLDVYVGGKKIPLPYSHLKDILNTSSAICENQMAIHGDILKGLLKEYTPYKSILSEVTEDEAIANS